MLIVDAPKAIVAQVLRKLQSDAALIKALTKAAESTLYLFAKEEQLIIAVAEFFASVSPLAVKWREDGAVKDPEDWPRVAGYGWWAPFGGQKCYDMSDWLIVEEPAGKLVKKQLEGSEALCVLGSNYSIALERVDRATGETFRVAMFGELLTKW